MLRPQQSTMRASDIIRLLLLAVGLPAVIQVADDWALRLAAEEHWSAPTVAMIYALFVVQVGVLGFAVGRFVRRWTVRWIVLVWGLALVDTMLYRLVVEQSDALGWRGWVNCLPYALLSGQFGLVAVWGAFGPVAWPWRLPTFLIATLLVASFGSALGLHREVWVALALIQAGATVGLCFVIGCLGFRLRLAECAATARRQPAGNRALQFSIAQMLFWMAALVPILLVAPNLDLGFLRYLSLGDWAALGLVGVALGVVSLTAVWAALGRAPAAARISALAIVPSWVAFLLKLATDPRGWPRNLISVELGPLGWGWVAWTPLAAWFLAGLLLMFRASGYRLERVARNKGSGFGVQDSAPIDLRAAQDPALPDE